jgi:hypothetical protein
MESSIELPDELYEELKRHCSRGDELADQGLHNEALDCYNAAWELIPEPKNNWNASTWVLAAIGDSCLAAGYLTSADEAFTYALTCPNGLGNPFVHISLGKIRFERGELDAAADELVRAYMGGGLEVFEGQDPKYLNFLRTRAVVLPQQNGAVR